MTMHMHQERMNIFIINHIMTNMVVSSRTENGLRESGSEADLGVFFYNDLIRAWGQNEGCLWAKCCVVSPPH